MVKFESHEFKNRNMTAVEDANGNGNEFAKVINRLGTPVCWHRVDILLTLLTTIVLLAVADKAIRVRR